MRILFIVLIVGILFNNPLQAESSLISVEFTAQGMTVLQISTDGNRTVIEQFQDTNLQTAVVKPEWRIWSYGHIALSDTGTKIAYIAQGDSDARLFIYDLGIGQRTDYPVSSSALQPVWSPDEAAILLHAPGLFIGYREAMPVPDDYVFELAAGQLNRLTETSGFIEHEWHWTQDSETLIFIGRDGERHYQLFSISSDGSNLHPMTAFVGDSAYLCKLTFHDGRWYYVMGCNDFLDSPLDNLYSTTVDGVNRLEFSLSDTFTNVDWAGIADIASANGKLYLLVKFIGSEQGQFDQIINVSDAIPTLIYEETGFGYTNIVVEPQGRYIALYNTQTIELVDINTQSIVFSQPLPENLYICNLDWSTHQQLMYSVGTGTECDIPDIQLEGIVTLTIGKNDIFSSRDSVSVADDQFQSGYLQPGE